MTGAKRICPVEPVTKRKPNATYICEGIDGNQYEVRGSFNQDSCAEVLDRAEKLHGVSMAGIVDEFLDKKVALKESAK